MTEGRIAERAPTLDLAVEEAGDVVPCRKLDRARIGLERLHQDAAGCVASAAPGELCQQLEGALRGGKALERGRECARLLDGIGVEPDAFQLWQLRLELALELLRAGAEPRQLRGVARGARLRLRLRVPAVMAAQEAVAVEDERDVAVDAAEGQPARTAVQRGRDTAAVEQQDRLAALFLDRPERGQQRRGERVARFAAQIDDEHRRQRTGEPPTEVEPLELPPALGSRSRAAEDSDCVFERSALSRHGSRVVTRI